ncbi:hypothetical protein MBLNU230_g6226t1 [Neophaeotheca triangularis]
MLSRTAKRVALDSQWRPLPFLLPWAANLTTVSHTLDTPSPPPPAPSVHPSRKPVPQPPAHNQPKLPPTQPTARPTPPALSDSVRENLSLLRAQGPHYITAHIYNRPYLLTAGDTLRLPFLMHGVEPGDILRLDRAVNLGSRDYTLKAGAAGPKPKSPTMETVQQLDPTTGTASSESRVMPAGEFTGAVGGAPHFVPHIAKGRTGYLDDRLFVCRAVVMGVESEPMRIKEKTKRRQRRVKTVKSKHRFTVLKIREVRVRTAEEIESGVVE